MAVIKHVGRHNNKKVAIVYRQVPDENHMALVLYTESIPSLLHDEVMKVLESEVGQNAKELADPLFRHTMADGNKCLETIHKSGYLKKVQANQVIVTVNASSSCRLDELNSILDKIEAGGEAAEKLAEMDANAGFAGGRDVGEAKSSASINTEVLDDSALAQQRLDQATKLKSEAEVLLAEAKRLEKEANELAPKTKNVRTAKKATA